MESASRYLHRLDGIGMGIVAIIFSYLFWALVPIFWKQFNHIGAFELLMHRFLWTLLFAFVLMVARRSFRDYLGGFRSRSETLRMGAASFLLAGNWFSFVYAVMNDRLTEASLGYFLTPLVLVFLGRVFEKEKMNRFQIAAVSLATIGVVILTWRIGYVPVLALAISASWGGYSLMKKRTSLGPVSSLGMEGTFLAPIAIAYLLWQSSQGTVAWVTRDLPFNLLIAFAGVITVFPLLTFSFAAKRVPMLSLGLFQYLVPTGQLLLAVYAYGEPFDSDQLYAFIFIWLGLIVFVGQSVVATIKETHSNRAI